MYVCIFICAVYYVKNNYITNTYKQKYDDMLSFKNHVLMILKSHVLMSIASSHVRFRLQKSELIMLNQVDVGLPCGHWY